MILIGNWKMNHASGTAASLTQELGQLSNELKKTELKVAPAFLSVTSALAAARETALEIGTQNIHWDESGAFTGEVSVSMAKEAGVTFALIGHSERRTLFGENDRDVCKRTEAALRGGIVPVVCVGETLEEREGGKTTEVLRTQLEQVFDLVNSQDFGTRLIIAYEPVWAIGTGKTASTKEIDETHQEIINFWNTKSDADCPPILYGGSVSPDNFGEISKIANVAGALVGGASLTFDKFSKLAEIAESA